MTFKDRKVPKHLVIQEEFEFKQRPKFSFIKLIFWSLLITCLTYGLVFIKQNGLT